MNILKSILAIMCLVCLLDMPYGYYELFSYVGSGLLIYFAIKEGNNFFWSFSWVVFIFFIQPFFEWSEEGRTVFFESGYDEESRVYILLPLLLIFSIFNILNIKNFKDYYEWMFLSDWKKGSNNKINWYKNTFSQFLNYLIFGLHFILFWALLSMFMNIDFNLSYFLVMSMIFLSIIINTPIRKNIMHYNRARLKVAKYINIGKNNDGKYFTIFRLTDKDYDYNLSTIVLQYQENNSSSFTINGYYAEEYKFGNTVFSDWYENFKVNNNEDNGSIDNYEFDVVKTFYFKNIMNQKDKATGVVNLFSEKPKDLKYLEFLAKI